MIVGFERSDYSVAENRGSVELCVSILGPDQIQLSDNVSADLTLTTEPITAAGKSLYRPVH